MTYNSKITLRTDTRENWDAATPYIPLDGEICIVWDNGVPRYKIGNGKDYVFNNGAQELPWASVSLDSEINSDSNNAVTGAAVAQALEKLSTAVYVTMQHSGDIITADKTFDELIELIKNGKEIFLKVNNLLVPYVGCGITSSSEMYSRAAAGEQVSSIYFQTQLGNNLYLYSCEEDGWQYMPGFTITTATLDQELSSTQKSTPPSTSCVYEAVNAIKTQIPNVPAWALDANKPVYTANEVGADSAGTAAAAITTHNSNRESHKDLRDQLKDLSDRLSALADSDDETLDQMSEIVAYIKNNTALIEQVTTSKISTSDIVNDLETNVSNKVLSAAQGVVLNNLIAQKSDFDGSYNSLTQKPNLIIGDKSYSINLSTSAPTVNDESIITLVKRGEG